MNDRTLNPEAVGDAVQELGVLDDAGVVTRVLLLDGLYLELAPAIHRGLVDPGGLLALEKPPCVGRDRAGVGGVGSSARFGPGGPNLCTSTVESGRPAPGVGWLLRGVGLHFIGG